MPQLIPGGVFVAAICFRTKSRAPKATRLAVFMMEKSRPFHCTRSERSMRIGVVNSFKLPSFTEYAPMCQIRSSSGSLQAKEPS